MAPYNELTALLEPPIEERQPARPEAAPGWLQAVANAVQRADVRKLVAAGLLPHEADAVGDRRVLAAAGSRPTLGRPTLAARRRRHALAGAGRAGRCVARAAVALSGLRFKQSSPAPPSTTLFTVIGRAGFSASSA
jgi:hypothetical protein